MCGLFGWQWKRDKVPPRELRVKLATILALENDRRGGTSFGYAYPKGGDVEIVKSMGHAVADISPMATQHFLMGHTRMPTRGAHIVDNTHPFVTGDVIGSHNGQIWNWDDLEKKYPERKKFAVDSEHLIAHLAEDKDLEELQGYGTVTYWDRRLGLDKLFLCRLSDTADLAIRATEHGVVWSSMDSALQLALEVAGLKSKADYKVKAHELYYVANGKLYTTKVKRKMSSRVYTSSSSGMYGYGHHQGNFSYATGMGHHSSTNDDWQTRRDKSQEEQEEQYRKAGGRDPNPKKNICEAPACHGDIKDGICQDMVSEACTGSKEAMDKFFQAMAAESERTDTAVTERASNHVAPLDELEWDPTGRQGSTMFKVDETDVAAIRVATCEACAEGIELTPGGYHEDPDRIFPRVYRACEAPTNLEMRVFGMAVEWAMTLPKLRRIKNGPAHDKWEIIVAGVAWSIGDAVRAKNAQEAAYEKARRESGGPIPLGAADTTPTASIVPIVKIGS